MKKIIILLFIFFPLTIFSQSMQVSRLEAEQAAIKALRLVGIPHIAREPIIVNILTADFGEHIAMYEITFESGEAVIIAGSKASQPILAIYNDEDGYSWLQNSEGRVTGFTLMLEKMYQQICQSFDGNNNQSDRWAALYSEEVIANRSEYGPYLQTFWNQDRGVLCDCKDMYNKYMDLSNGDCEACHDEDSRYPAGCTVTALAQIMNFWKYPVLINSTEQIDWCKMPKQIKCMGNGASTEEQNDAVARFFKILGETLGAHYGSLTDNTDNNLNINRCFGYLNPANTTEKMHDFFGYSNNMCVKARLWYNSSDWSSMIEREIIEGRPVLYWAFDTIHISFTNPQINAHTFVCDGFNEATNLFHFNWGHNNDGWCSINNIVEGSCHWTIDECAMIGIMPGGESDFCNATLYLDDFYNLFYITHDIYNCFPFDVTPHTATRLFSSSGLSPAIYRTILANYSAEYQAHREIVLRDGFTAEYGSDFTARIVSCPSCEENRNMGEDYSVESGGEQPVDMAPSHIGNVIATDTQQADIYPNPTDGELTMAIDGDVEAVVVLDINGNPQGGWDMLSFNEERITLNVRRLKAGAYLLTVRHPGGRVESARFIKQ